MSVHVKVAGTWQEIAGVSGPEKIPFTAEGGTKGRYVADGTNGENGVAYITHTFLSDGEFRANGTAYVDVLLVGGGGRGGDSVDADRGWQTGGGSGGGGQVLETNTEVTKTAIPVDVGDAGQNTTFGSLLARRGGNGASHGPGEGGTDVGGGGGGCMYHNECGTATVAGQGGAGGCGDSLRSGGAGGGGGPEGTAASGGTAGTGTTSSLTGVAKRYGDGGPHAIEANTGHGGSGAGGGGTGSPGSSGIVVVRYREDTMIDAPPPAAPIPVPVATGGTESDITDDGVEFHLHDFTANGDLIVTEAGYAEVLIVSGGSSGGGEYANNGTGGGITSERIYLEVGTHAVVVGGGAGGGGATATGNGGQVGGKSALGNLWSPVSTGYNAAPPNAPLTTTFRGVEETFSAAGGGQANTGNGGTKAGCCGAPPGQNGGSGRVMVRYAK